MCVAISPCADLLATVLSELLGWPAEMLIYKKLKVIKDRPKPEAFSLAVRRYNL